MWHPAVGAGALGVVGAKAARGVHALGHLCVDVARPVLPRSALLDKRLKRRAAATARDSRHSIIDRIHRHMRARGRHGPGRVEQSSPA